MKTPEQKRAAKQEKRTAQTYGGRETIMSGQGWKQKHDVRSDEFLIENKTRHSGFKSYSVDGTLMRDLTLRARMEGRTPLLQFDMMNRRYVVLNEDDFLEILEQRDDT